MVRAKRRAVFLDRDGTLNRAEVKGEKPYSPRRLQDFRLLPGVATAARKLKRAGFRLIVITNQPDIGNGDVPAETVAAMHRRLRTWIPVDDIRMCPHSQTLGCRCRKPKPGLLMDASRKYRLDLRRSYMVGDRVSDVLAGHAAGCYTIFIDQGYGESHRRHFPADSTVRDFSEAARRILSRAAAGL